MKRLRQVRADSVGETFKIEPGSDDPYLGSGRDGQGLNLPRSKPSLPHDVGINEFNAPDRESPQVWNLDENPNEYGTQLTEFYDMYDFDDDPLRASTIDEDEIESWHPITDENYVGGPARSEARLKQLARDGLWRFKSEDPNWRSQENLVTPYMANNWTDPPEDFDPAPNKGSHLNVDEENFDVVNLKISETSNAKMEDLVTPEEELSRNDNMKTILAAMPLLPVALKWLPKESAVLTLMALGVVILGRGPQLKWMELTSVRYNKLVSEKRYNSEVVLFDIEAEVRTDDKVLKVLHERGTFAESCLRLYRTALKVK